jgi:NAD+ diphosphatase
MNFVHLAAPGATPAATDVCLIIQGDRMLAGLVDATAVTLPPFGLISRWPHVTAPLIHLGLIEGRTHWVGSTASGDLPAPEGWGWHETRAVMTILTPAQWHAISCARQLLWWQGRHRFCGACGTPTIEVETERARRCPACQALFFPVVSSAVIVAVTRGDELLLAHNHNFRPGLFSLLAGFVDPGETLEQAAVREVREEVGVTVDQLDYVTSQPWPFPNSLMIGFRAQYLSGDVRVDGKEIEQAAWYRRDNLPEIPRRGTIARLLIDRWLEEGPPV